MPNLSDIQTVIDFGIVVLLWLVQIVIYPSFLRVEASQLAGWHQTYTFRVSFVIMPLLLTQLALAVAAVLSEATSWLDGLVLTLVLICWGLTFFVSVPLHRRIDAGDLDPSTRQALIRTNWPRTILWTAIFCLGLVG
ncbi:MAG: hypothetical protein GVY36_11155 [Verrucomicrobia bacterium]|jgi:hypothetical protein|nr:hypothetical protein [Verrucomicrobiota bacterium]